MQGFNLNNLQGAESFSVESSTGTRLKSNTIHDCFVSSVEIKTINTTNNGEQKVVEIIFSNEEGKIIPDTIWQPRSDERKSEEKEGKIRISASEWDYFNFKIRLYAKVFAPKFYIMLKDGKVPVIPSWDKMCELLVKSFGEGVTNKTMFKLKVLDREDASGNVFPTLPRYFLSNSTKVDKPEFFVSNRYIGNENEVKFSDYELNKIKERASIKATPPDHQIPTAPADDRIPGNPKEEVISNDDITSFLNSLPS